jgi:hypothetical protein
MLGINTEYNEYIDNVIDKLIGLLYYIKKINKPQQIHIDRIDDNKIVLSEDIIYY